MVIGRFTLATTLAVFALHTPGCGDGLRDIDEKTDRLLAERSSLIGRDSVPPRRTSLDQGGDGGAEPISRSRVTAKRLDTVNPGADELRYTIADEAREVADRLEEYQSAPEQGETVLDLEESLRIFQQTGREYITAEEDYIFAAIRLLIERHLWSPRLFAESSAAISGSGDDGRFDNAVRVLNELRVTQRLPAGGDVSARWVWDATENLRSSVTGQYRQASAIILEGSIPLLRGAGSVAQESLIQAERDLIYSARNFEDDRRILFVSIARDYFNLLQQVAAITNQKNQLDSLRQSEMRETALLDAGRIAEFELNITRNEVLRALGGLTSQREFYTISLDAFRIRLGLTVEGSVALRPVSLALPEPDITPQDAAELALAYRLDLQNRRDQADDARRGILNARNALLPDLDLAGNVTFPTDPDEDEGGFVYELDDTAYSAGVTFGLPLDREIERLQLRAAAITLQRQRRELDRFRDEIVVEARQRVREIDRARFNLRLAEESVRINERRLAEQKIKEAEVRPQERIDTENALLDARNARDQAITDLRNAILDYLLTTGQLRVARDGTLLPLPGMEFAPPAEEPAPTPDAEPGPDPAEPEPPPAPDAPQPPLE